MIKVASGSVSQIRTLLAERRTWSPTDQNPRKKAGNNLADSMSPRGAQQAWHVGSVQSEGGRDAHRNIPGPCGSGA